MVGAAAVPLQRARGRSGYVFAGRHTDSDLAAAGSSPDDAVGAAAGLRDHGECVLLPWTADRARAFSSLGPEHAAGRADPLPHGANVLGRTGAASDTHHHVRLRFPAFALGAVSYAARRF